ncbi:MAG TPA: outer membrane lipoprotein carrier protein LolA [Gemmatimonadales bacterium]|nr:outer membrane lipoprotein carrier protein LolA [Gemmatimonadales bacterium]
MTARALSLLTLLLAPSARGAASRGQEPDPTAIVTRAAEKYRAIRSFSADFRQVIEDSMIGTYSSTGTLVQAGDAKLAMRFTDPKGDAIVMDGEHIWVYTPSTTPGQVIRLKIPSDPTYGPNVLAWILSNPAERYRSRYLRTDAVAGRAADVIALTPLDKTLPFTEAVVWLDQFDSLPRRLEVRERSGQRRTLVFTGVETNRQVGPDTFHFDVPSGTRIVDQ